MTDSPIGPPFDPDGVFLGALRVDRICYDHAGRTLRVMSQGQGSTTVRRVVPARTYFKSDGTEVIIRATYETIALSLESVVYTTRQEKSA